MVVQHKQVAIGFGSRQRRLTASWRRDRRRLQPASGFDEAGTARTLQEHRAAVDSIAAALAAEIVKMTGDGVLWSSVDCCRRLIAPS